MNKRIVFLIVTTWADAGVAFRGEHYYGRLECGPFGDKEEHELLHVMTREQVHARNKQCERDDDPYRYGIGESSSAFWSREELYIAARTAYKEKFPDAEILIAGDSGVYNPQEILECTDTVLGEKLQAIYVEWEAMYTSGQGNDDQNWQPLCDQWTTLLDPFDA